MYHNQNEVTPEELATLDPDVILYSSELEKENIIQSELFKTKKAVAEDSVIAIDKTLLLNHTQSVVDSIRTIAEMLYPEVDFVKPEPVASSEPVAE